ARWTRPPPHARAPESPRARPALARPPERRWLDVLPDAPDGSRRIRIEADTWPRPELQRNVVQPGRHLHSVGPLFGGHRRPGEGALAICYPADLRRAGIRLCARRPPARRARARRRPGARVARAIRVGLEPRPRPHGPRGRRSG